MVVPVSLSAQQDAEQAAGDSAFAFFTENDSIVYKSGGMGGGSEGKVTEIDVQDNKVVLNVFVPAKKNPNAPPWYEPKDTNTEMIIYFENGDYYLERPDTDKVKGVLNDIESQKSLFFELDMGGISFIVNK